MPFQVSPGVNVSEIDLTTVVPAVSTTEGALAGVFKWGPVNTRVLVDSEESLVNRFGKPTTGFNPETFFTAANFLAYGNKLYVTRVADATAKNAVSNGSSTAVVVNNSDAIDTVSLTSNDHFVAKYPGVLGNSIKVTVARSANDYSEASTGTISITAGAKIGTTNQNEQIGGTGLIQVGDKIQVGNTSSGVGVHNLTITAANTTTFTFAEAYTGAVNISSLGYTRFWGDSDMVSSAPGTTAYTAARSGAGDEIHVVVKDEDGSITGTVGQVLEVFEGLSRATDSKTESGESNWWIDVINNQSNYIWAKNAYGLAANTTAAASTALATENAVYDSLKLGADSGNESSIALASLVAGYDYYKSAEDVDVSLILTGKSTGGTNGEGLGKYIIDNIAESRKDCVAFISPERADVVNNVGGEADAIVTFRNSLTSSSYALLDSGYKYQYDKYNDVYTYVPLNGDTAGLAVKTDELRDAWFSPAGFNRGQVKNIVKLPYNPKKADRDVLYKADINPVVTFPGQGTVLFGDKTLLGKPSAFDRINVRRLFIVLEKAISTASKFTLFEFNDSFTRSQFRNLVEPFLRDVQGRRGIFDFKVVCDETNNTGEVIDGNRFVGDIYIKPAKSINFIQLNFVAVRSGVEFSEIVGQF
jgi:phage tail sheath protein FI